MKIKHLFPVLLLILASCKPEKEKAEQTFVYSFFTSDSAFSLKFTNGDTLYIKNHLKPIPEYYALLEGAHRDSLLALANGIDFAKYDSIYNFSQKDKDGTGIKFYRIKNNKTQGIFLINDGPKELFVLANRFNGFTKSLDFNATTAKQDYGNLDGIVLPPPVQILKAPKTSEMKLRLPNSK